ncbi:site-specific DNA-methyltransferase [Myxococcota bacterium]|nr:site-specific DNA-methyltransferase [Myxococcota bacterium]
MRLSFTLIESTLVGTVHSSGGVQRHRMAYRPQEAIALTREILGTLQEGVRLGAKASAAEPALKLLGSRLARTIMSEQLLLLLAGAEGELVLDNCIGSGTTAIAALNTGRHFIGIEQELEYVEIARRRISERLL